MNAKKWMSCLLAGVLCVNLSAQALAVKPAESSDFSDVADRAVASYTSPNGEFLKISHPEKPASTKTTNVTDGLLDYLGNGRVGIPGVDKGAKGQGDRGQTYSWASASYGDWMYVATLYNASMNTVTLMDNGLGHNYDPKLIKSIFDTMFRGEFFVEEEDGKNPGSTLCKINVKTGEVQLLMSKEKTGTNVNFRHAIRMGNKLYFCGSVNGIPSIYEVAPEENDKLTCVFQDESMKVPDAWPQALKKQLSPAIRGMTEFNGYLVINCVGLDENPYIAISKDPSKGFTKIAFAWEDVAKKIPGELLGYPACHLSDSIYGGSIWEIIPFNGKLYVAICTGTPENSPDGGKTMQSFAILRGEVKGDPEKRESWTWTPVIGDKADGARYTFGIDPERTRSGACNMMVYKDHLYIGEYNDTEIALVNILFGVDAQFMADNLDQSVNLYRMDKDENIELVMGDPTKMFPKSLSGLGSGFGKNENQYIWKMDTFQDKLYVGTFDESSILYPVGQFSTGDILGLTPEQWQRQVKYLKKLVRDLIDSAKNHAQPLSAEGAVSADQLAALQEMAHAKPARGRLSLLDLPATYSNRSQVDSLADLHGALLSLSGMLAQGQNWTEDQKLDTKVRFAEFYQMLYDCYKANESRIPDAVKAIYEQVLNPKNLSKVQSMAHCVVSLAGSVRGFDLMVSEDGIHFNCISRDGLGDGHNQGVRAFAVSRDEKNPWMCLGTANPFYGTQIWRLEGEGLNLPPVQQVVPKTIQVNFLREDGSVLFTRTVKANQKVKAPAMKLDGQDVRWEAQEIALSMKPGETVGAKYLRTHFVWTEKNATLTFKPVSQVEKPALVKPELFHVKFVKPNGSVVLQKDLKAPYGVTAPWLVLKGQPVVWEAQEIALGLHPGQFVSAQYLRDHFMWTEKAPVLTFKAVAQQDAVKPPLDPDFGWGEPTYPLDPDFGWGEPTYPPFPGFPGFPPFPGMPGFDPDVWEDFLDKWEDRFDDCDEWEDFFDELEDLFDDWEDEEDDDDDDEDDWDDDWDDDDDEDEDDD